MSEGISGGRFTLAVAAALAIGLTGGFFVDRATSGDSIREYLLENPEILEEMVQALQTREARANLAEVRGELETPFPGAVLGNPQGSVTLVEFADYACGFCRASADEIERLIVANPDLRVVIREWPILTEASDDAARMALAAARQGKYSAFHQAMYDAESQPPESVEWAAKKVGLDMERAERDLADPALDRELAANTALARQMGFNGTPAWIVGDRVLAGAVGQKALATAIEEAREQ